MCAGNGDVAEIEGSIGSHRVTVGLDSMSSMSLISPAVVAKIPHTRKILEVPISVGVAGSNVLANVTESVLVRLSLPGYKNISVDFSIELGVLPIPTDILISWSDIKGFNLLPLLSKMSEVCAAVAEPPVAEECYEAEVISSSELPNQLALPQGAFGDQLRVL